MGRWLVVVVVWLLGAGVGVASASGQGEVPPHAHYGESATYLVTREGAPAGTHELFFGGDEGRLTVTAKTRATMSIFGVFKVPFIYDSRAVWQEGALLTLSASFSGEGEKEFWVRREGDGYETQSGARTAAALMPTNHWNNAVLDKDTLFNTLNGRVIAVTIQPRGEETLLIGGRETAAMRYDVSGELDISLWYDEKGKWLQLQFRVLGSDYQFTYLPDEDEGGGDDG